MRQGWCIGLRLLVQLRANNHLEAYDFSNKTITLFATSGSSGLGNTVNELKVSAPNALIKEGLLLNNLTTQKVKELLAL